MLSRSAYRRGDVDAALAASAHTVHEVFQTQRVEHAFFEPESTLAVAGPDGTLRCSRGTGVWDDRRQIAAVLALPPNRSLSSRSPTAALSAARRTSPTRADGAGRLVAPAPREVHPLARSRSCCIPSGTHPDGVLGRLRRRRPAHRFEGADDRGHRAVRVRGHEGPRTRRRARLGALPTPGDRR